MKKNEKRDKWIPDEERQKVQITKLRWKIDRSG